MKSIIGGTNKMPLPPRIFRNRYAGEGRVTIAPGEAAGLLVHVLSTIRRESLLGEQLD